MDKNFLMNYFGSSGISGDSFLSAIVYPSDSPRENRQRLAFETNTKSLLGNLGVLGLNESNFAPNFSA